MTLSADQTTDAWPTGKIIKHIILPKPKDAPPAGKKEKRLRLMFFVGFGLLALYIFAGGK